MKKVNLIVSLFFLISFSLSAEWVSLGGFEGQKPEIRVMQDYGLSITVEFELKGYTVEQVDINGITCSRIILPGEVTFLEKGFPELPTIVRSVIIPDDALMGYRIVSVEYETKNVNRLVPSKGNILRSIDSNTIPYTFDKFYQTDSWWPNNTVEICEPFILRDYRGVSIRFNPFQYNPAKNELKVAKRVVVKVYEISKGGTNVMTKKKDSITREFVNIYENIFLNFNGARYDSISEYAGRMVIISADAFMSNMEDFVEWKMMKGIDTKMVPISSIGNTEPNIKNFIQNEYNAGDLVWVLLVGDGNEVVPATGTMGLASGRDADPVYAYTAGGDYYPDIFISRFSSRSGNSSNIDKQVSRSIDYEKTPQTGVDWYHVGLGVASDQTGMSPYADSTRCNWLRDSLLAYTYTEVNKSYDYWGTTAMIKGFIEDGTSIINYIGHGGTTGWGNGGGFDISDINSLNNPWMLPFVISVACDVGNFNGSDCYCEASVTAGTVSEPDGFLVHWGATIGQSWVPPCYGQEGAVNLLTHDGMNTAGGIFFNGACYMIDHYGPTNAEGIEMAQTWHIFGDASIQLRTDTPQSMTVNHNDIIYFGTTTFDVTVVGIENALCALFRNDTLYGSAYTNASGFATIDIDPPLTSAGDITLTVTAYNKIPYIITIPVQPASGPYISFLKGIIDDTSGGNGNGRINPGETIDLTAWAKNIGVETGYGIYGILSETDPYVSISVDSTWFGNIAAGDSSSGTPSYVFSVANNCLDGYIIIFDFVAQDVNDSIWTSHPLFTVYAPILTLNSFVVDPTGNQRLDPGETVDLIVTLENKGNEDAPSVAGYLSENSPYVDVPDPDGSFGDITSGGTVSNSGDPFVVHADAMTPMGELVTFMLEVTSGVYCDTLEFSTTVGSKHYLIWDPDDNQSSGPAIDAALQACGYVGDYSTSLPIADLDNYLAVFVCVGIWWDNYVILDGSAEATALVNFVNSGGRMYLEGADVWYYDPLSGGYDFGPLFGINATADGSGDLVTVNGQSGSFTEGMSFSYTGESSYIDHISAISPAFLIFRNSSPVYDCGVAYDAGSYKTVGTSFEFGGLSDGSPPSTKETLADSIMHFFGIYVGIEEEPVSVLNLPKVYGLSNSYPNPCGNNVVINYQVPRKGKVSLRVYDVSGRLTDVLIDGVVEPGYHSFRLDTEGYASGVYFYRLVAGDKTFTRKMIVVK